MNAVSLDRLLATKAGQALVAELAADTLAERTRLVKELRELERSADRGSKPLADAHAQARAAVEDAERALQAARAQMHRTQAEWAVYSNSLDRARARITRRLIETAPRGIDEALATLAVLRDRARTYAPQSLAFDFDTRQRETGRMNELQREHLAAINAAIAEVELLRLEAMPAEALAERLAAIQARIPSAYAEGVAT